MNIHIDPNTYALFERVIRERLETATTVRVELEGTRANGSTFTYTQQLRPNEFDRIPWGKIDAILEAEWCPGYNPDRRTHYTSPLMPEHMYIQVRLDTHSNGISVESSLYTIPPATIGVKGTMGWTGGRESIKCDTEDEVVGKITELIDELTEAYRSQKAMEAEDHWYDDGESRFDPLDERNYPLEER